MPPSGHAAPPEDPVKGVPAILLRPQTIPLDRISRRASTMPGLLSSLNIYCNFFCILSGTVSMSYVLFLKQKIYIVYSRSYERHPL
jgi:hypothetical protein